MNRQEAERRGRRAENLASLYLRLKGWRILARRARVPGGEVDIVARRGRTLAFVEVKARGDEEAAAFALRATCAKATTSALTRCTSSPAACRATSPTSGKGDRRRPMSLRIAVQMDPLERINVAGDSTFALMLKAQQLGHQLYHY